MIGFVRALVRGETNIDFIGRSRMLTIVAASVVVGSALAILGPGLDRSLEFTGGTLFQVPKAPDVEVTVIDVEAALADFALDDRVIQIVRPLTGGASIEVRAQRVDAGDAEGLKAALATVAGQLDEDERPLTGEVNERSVGASWGQEVQRKAIRALIVFLVLVTVYISMRFEFKMALAALAALAHDLIAAAGVYALTGLNVSPATLIAILTLMGLSLYDTIVVFDRVKENEGQIGVRESYGQMVNRSLNEVLMRTVNTSITTVLPVGAMLFVGVFLLGADTLKDLATAMFIGTVVGIYSSIFVAAPVLTGLKEMEPRYKMLKARVKATKDEPVASEPAPAEEAPAKAPPAVTTASGRQVRPRRPAKRRRR